MKDCRPLDTRNETEYINQVGCTSQVKHVFLHWLDTLIVIQISMAIFTFVGIVGSAVWIRSRRQRAVRKYNVREYLVQKCPKIIHLLKLTTWCPKTRTMIHLLTDTSSNKCSYSNTHFYMIKIYLVKNFSYFSIVILSSK